MREIGSVLAAAVLAGCASQTVCEKLESWQQQNGSCAASTLIGGIEGGPWIPPATSCASGFAQCSLADQKTLEAYANCLPGCPANGNAYAQLTFQEKLTFCVGNKSVATSCADALNGLGGSSSGGGASTGTGAGTSGATTTTGSSTRASSSGGGSSSGGTTTGSSTGGGSTGGGSSSGGTTGCVAYGSACTGPCCSGLTCDAATAVCLVAAGQPCPNQSCASPDVCGPTGVCGPCLSQNSACTVGGPACCSGFSCKKSNGNKYYCL